jgi:hypothetical protein
LTDFPGKPVNIAPSSSPPTPLAGASLVFAPGISRWRREMRSIATKPVISVSFAPLFVFALLVFLSLGLFCSLCWSHYTKEKGDENALNRLMARLNQHVVQLVHAVFCRDFLYSAV